MSVEVFVLDHGRHSSLMLPSEEGLVRYSWGDFDYYALGHTGVLSGLRALLLKTPAALGRQPLPTAHNLDAALMQLKVPVQNSIKIHVEAGAVEMLASRLERQFTDASETVHNPDYGVDFILSPHPYTFDNNSNRHVGAWLVELGCKINGHPWLSDWQRDTDRREARDPL